MKQLKLFSNSYKTGELALVQKIADKQNNILIVTCNDNIYKDYLKHFHFRFGGNLLFKADELEGLEIAKLTQEKINNALLNRKKPSYIKALFILSNYFSKHKTYIIKNVKLSKIYKDITGKKANIKDKQLLTAGIEILRTTTLFIRHPKDKSRIITIPILTFADTKYKTYKRDITDKKGNILHKKGDIDYSIIDTIYRMELLPGINKYPLLTRYYPAELLALDSNKDGGVINMGFVLSTRFSQVNYKPVNYDRHSLISIANYEDTEKSNPSRANQLLKKCFEKLKRIKVIRDYEPKKLTTDPRQKITFYPYKEEEKIKKMEVKNG